MDCAWPGEDVLMRSYHDTEWGLPLHDEQKFFEFLILDAMQAGLSWKTVLHKRENFRKAFANFDPNNVAKFDSAKVEQLMQDAGIIRNRLKIEASIANAKGFLQIQKEFGSFDHYIWQFVGGHPLVSSLENQADIPAQSAESIVMSKELRKRGFNFVGPTICYAFMQAAGLVNDHINSCTHKSRGLPF